MRPSTVTASLVGPDGVARQTQTGPRAPGTYTLDWTGRTAQGAPEPEGRWRWVVNAVDDRGQASRAERVFYLNNTLGYLRVSPSRVVVRRRGGALRVAFRLAHPATVTLKIRTVSGATVQTVRRRLRAGHDEHPLERALRQRSPRLLRPVRRQRASGERLRPDPARAPIPGAPRPLTSAATFFATCKDFGRRRDRALASPRSVLRRTVITALLFAVFAAPAHAGKVSLMPGVSYERQLQFTPTARSSSTSCARRGPAACTRCDRCSRTTRSSAARP